MNQWQALEGPRPVTCPGFGFTSFLSRDWPVTLLPGRTNPLGPAYSWHGDADRADWRR